MGRGYTYFPFEPHKGKLIANLSDGFLRGWLRTGEKIGTKKNERLHRSMELELERRRKQNDKSKF